MQSRGRALMQSRGRAAIKASQANHPTALSARDTLIPLEKGDCFQVECLRKQVHQVHRRYGVAGL
jgi:hypothetical protein